MNGAALKLKSRRNNPIPVVDLFAGAGGLGEGFSSLRQDGSHPFAVRLSVESDVFAHQTLLLRAFFRQFVSADVPDEYYQHLRGEISRSHLFAAYPSQAQSAEREAWCATLGDANLGSKEIDERIDEARNGSPLWVLVGGPPCQAYSTIGRARNRSKAGYRAEEDHRHFLYREYLRILKEHRPPVFLMENVTGMLSARVNGESIFSRILGDLQNPDKALDDAPTIASYRIYSLSKECRGFDLFGESENSPGDYIVECGRYGLPQRRHRVLLLGVRQDIRIDPGILRPSQCQPTVSDVIADLPKVRAGLSFRSARGREEGAASSHWRDTLKEAVTAAWAKSGPQDSEAFNATRRLLRKVAKKIAAPRAGRGAEAIVTRSHGGPAHDRDWYHDPRLKAVCNHSARDHMASDLHRYIWAACYAQENKVSPRIKDFPKELWPAHKNVNKALRYGNFSDRFRVQLRDGQSTTITSHIGRDGHYYIHYDPTQCRSFTVREAARLQGFPDNYLFCGGRTEQYIQVGNAVPPLLSRQIAKIILDLLAETERALNSQDHAVKLVRERATRSRRSVSADQAGTVAQAS